MWTVSEAEGDEVQMTCIFHIHGAGRRPKLSRPEGLERRIAIQNADYGDTKRHVWRPSLEVGAEFKGLVGKAVHVERFADSSMRDLMLGYWWKRFIWCCWLC
jgi:hypothetical protein